ncbi:MAG TPA: hypothetical protein VJO32_18100 [Ktedonobacteraceae bacterium]|nr:hypothetical protein [Ktedonobacteraceae bacterium]
MTYLKKYTMLVALAFGIFFLAGCGGASNTTTTPPSATTQSVSTPGLASTEQPVPVSNGTQVSGSDIPDTQVFVTYASSQGKFQLDTPEGWAQSINGTDVSFVSNLNAMQVAITSAATAPTASGVRADQVATLQQTGRAVRDVQVKDVQLASGMAVLITYTSNSDPNGVTGKQVRLENNRYLFYKNGKLATLTLSAPVGADNVDQWARIANSFKWI